jgi:flagellar biogenesis protein FliO
MDDMINQFAAIVLLFTVVGGILWFTRRTGMVQWSLRTSNAVQAVTVVQRIVLTPNHTAHLIEVRGRQILVGCSPRSCEMIADVTGTSAGSLVSQEPV